MTMFKLLREKHHTINHMIIFNNSINKFYQCNIWSFCQGIYMFFSTCLGKENAEVIKFLGILKKYVSKSNIFVPERKAIFHLIKNYFCLSHNFQTWFHNADHLLYYPKMSAFSFHTFFVFLCQSLRNGT